MTDRESSQGEKSRPRASYGKACLACVTSKTKCEPSVNSRKCKRCLNLNKDCQPAPTKRKTGTFGKRSQPSLAFVVRQTADLEQKVDGITQLLQASRAGQNEALGGPKPGNRSVASSTHTSELTREESTTTHSNYSLNTDMSATSNFPMPQHTTRKVEIEKARRSTYIPETEAEEQEYLEMYRDRMVQGFPVVPLHAEETVASMHEDRPFLWLVIRATCDKNVPRKIELGKEIRFVLAQEMIVEGTKNMDLLLGIIVYCSWCHHWVFRKPILMLAIHLGMSLVCDLSLHKPVVPEQDDGMLNIGSQGCPKPPHLFRRGPRTMEERRALVSLFFITSGFAIWFQRIEIPKWTTYHEECLRILEQTKEHPTDAILVHIVRVQLIKNRIMNTNWLEQPNSPPLSQRIRQEFYLNTIAPELEGMKAFISENFPSNPILDLQMLDVAISLHEYSLNSSHPTSGSTQATANVVDASDEASARFEALTTLLANVKSYLTLVFDQSYIPVTKFPELSMMTFLQMAHAIMVLFRLSTFECPGFKWNKRRVIEEMDFGDVVFRWANTWKKVPLHCGLVYKAFNASNLVGIDPEQTAEWERRKEEEDAWLYAGKVFELLGETWRRKILPKLMQEDESSQHTEVGIGIDVEMAGTGSQGQQQSYFQPFGGFPEGMTNWDMVDDRWFSDLFAEGGQEWVLNH